MSRKSSLPASWLNMVEIEIGVLRSQCLGRRIGDRKTLEAEIAAWEWQRNAAGARIKWMFTTQRARIKATTWPSSTSMPTSSAKRPPRLICNAISASLHPQSIR